MAVVNIIAQVQALQPRWIDHEHNSYRLYINDDLITERTWIWNIDTVIEENVWVELSSHVVHTIRLHPIRIPNSSIAQFGLRNFRINDNPIPDQGGTETQLSFIIE
jgi:hypothetical protein